MATELTDSGVDVTLDKWDLREGHDAVAFMETMVTDPSISKVIIICDRVYASKADGRSGGVGTETQIISAEVYAKRDQDKFVAVIAEKDAEGKPYLPTYYKSRIYIDLSESERYAENFEKLLRWLFDKPLYTKPEIGNPPTFIVEPEAPTLGTSVLAKRVIEGARNDKGYTRGALDEYLSIFAEQLERFRITFNDDEPDEKIVESIEAFVPARDEFVRVLTTLIQYTDSELHINAVHKFFESCIPYLYRPADVNQWSDINADNFTFIIHELFLYTVALLLRGESIELATHLLSQPYYVAGNNEYGGNRTRTFAVFRDYMRSLEVRNKRLNARRLSLRADFLEKRSKSSGVQFRHLMQADFVCFLRAELSNGDPYGRWWPETLLYANRHYGAFELFARASSKAYLSRLLTLLGVASLDAIKAKLDEYGQDRSALPRWEFESIEPATLAGFEQLGTTV